MVHKVNNENFLKQNVYFTKDFTQNFKERHQDRRKESQASNPKNGFPEEAPSEKSPKDMILYESFDFSK